MDLQTRSAVAVASFIEFCTRHNISQPPDKIVKNLCTFLCQDVEKTPTFVYSRKFTNGILSFQDSATKDGTKVKASEVPRADEGRKSQLARRGASLAFDQLSARFGAGMFKAIPTMWQSMAGGLVSAFRTGTHLIPMSISS